jgi:hypothetical protein
MNIEELTKSQIVLLTLLVSFVTSIATGIVTVSLMQQAPPAITQSVSRVIRETVQTVAPNGSQSAGVGVTQEKTVIVDESDLVAKAIAAFEPSVVRLYTSASGDEGFAGLGIVLDASGTIAADSSALSDSPDATLVLSTGEHVRAQVRSRDAVNGIAYLSPIATSTRAWHPATISAQHVVLGQSVIALSGSTVSRVASGMIVSLSPGSATSSPQILETSIPGGSSAPGSPLIDTDGALVGLNLASSRAAGASDFVSASMLLR